MMKKTEQQRVIQGLLDPLDASTNVDAGAQLRIPVSTYLCPERAQQEWDLFFQDYPSILGLAADLPEAGTFFTNTDLGKPILCTRDNEGRFQAFLNVCRHRGVVVEAAASGKKQTFSCPFHAWTYSNQGELVAVPREDHFGPVDKSCRGLVRLPAEEKHGLLFVNPNPNGSLDLDARLGELGPELESWNLGRFVGSGAVTYPHAMNWKLANDTFGETYHFNVLHKNTLAHEFYGNVQMYDTFERNHRMMLCLKNIETLRHQSKAEWRVLEGSLPVYFLFPNVQLIIGREGPTLVRVYPEEANPHASYSKISFYLDSELLTHAESEATRQVLLDIQGRMRGFGEIIQQEDYVAAASSHVGMRSGAQEYLIFGRNEPALHHYHNTYRSALGLPPLTVNSH